MVKHKWTMAGIRAKNKAAGYHWFDKASIRFFDTKLPNIVKQGPGGVYFVSSEQFHGSMRSAPRRYTVRSFDPVTGEVDTVGPYNELDRDEAIQLAKKYALG
jgi:hypothetical protein